MTCPYLVRLAVAAYSRKGWSYCLDLTDGTPIRGPLDGYNVPAELRAAASEWGADADTVHDVDTRGAGDLCGLARDFEAAGFDTLAVATWRKAAHAYLGAGQRGKAHEAALEADRIRLVTA